MLLTGPPLLVIMADAAAIAAAGGGGSVPLGAAGSDSPMAEESWATDPPRRENPDEVRVVGWRVLEARDGVETWVGASGNSAACWDAMEEPKRPLDAGECDKFALDGAEAAMTGAMP